MRCPVCDKESKSMLCPQCGFDSSRDYGKYPTFGPVGKVPSVSALRQEREAKPESQEEMPSVIPERREKLRKKLPWISVLVCSAMLAMGIWVGSAMVGSTAGSTKPQEDAEPWKKNVLRSDVPQARDDGVIYNTDAISHSVFGSEYRRDRIKSVTFLDTLEDAPQDAWDVSEAGDGSVLAWVMDKGWWTYDLFIGADGGISAGKSCLAMFAGYNRMEKITFGDAFHTDNTEDMGIMFWWCDDLTELDLSGWDTGNVQRMADMFSCCRVLKDLDLSSFDTRNVQDMSSMFVGCWELKSLDLGHFDTNKVEDMHDMFSDCKKLVKLELSSFDMTNVHDTTNMFSNCPAGEDWGHLLK